VWAGSNIPAGLGIDRAGAQDLFSVEQSSQDVIASAFPQSIASGDPQPQGIVLEVYDEAAHAGREPAAPRRLRTEEAPRGAKDQVSPSTVVRGTGNTSPKSSIDTYERLRNVSQPRSYWYTR
jgi:hypothetical protein